MHLDKPVIIAYTRRFDADPVLGSEFDERVGEEFKSECQLFDFVLSNPLVTIEDAISTYERESLYEEEIEFGERRHLPHAFSDPSAPRQEAILRPIDFTEQSQSLSTETRMHAIHVKILVAVSRGPDTKIDI